MSVVLSRYLHFPLADFIKRTPVRARLNDLERTQWLAPESLREDASRKLALVIETAKREAPFYARSLAGLAEVRPENAIERLEQAPMLTKGDIFLHRDAMRSRCRRRGSYRGHTSGSGGEALEFYFSRDFLTWTEAAQWRGRGWWGIRRGDPILTLWGRMVSDPKSAARTARRERLRNWLRISAFELSHRELLAHYRAIREFEPRAIYGYSSAIYQLALFYSEHALPPPPGLRAIIFTADALLSFQRRVVVETLGAPAVCEYGSSEAGAFAFECREGGVHVASENIHLEILREGRPVADGEEGEVVVTVLRNLAMPLIRYNIGDWARKLPGRCGCGRHSPRIELTNTKVVDLVSTSSGGVASGQFFDYILIELIDRGLRGIRQFLVIQKSLDRFIVQVVPGPEFGPECLELFERRMRQQLGEQIEVAFEKVSEIPREPAGKIRCFRSEIGSVPEEAQTAGATERPTAG